MKPPSPKLHLLDVSEPLLSFSNLEMRCGIVLKNARMMFGRVEELKAEMSLPFNVCIKCLQLNPPPSEKREYLYGLIEAERGQEVKGEAA